jgi:sec-independent protein translocase protein TatA
MPTMPGGTELIIILFIILLLFGAKKLPGLAGSVGTSIREFRKASQEANEDPDDIEQADAPVSTDHDADA